MATASILGLTLASDGTWPAGDGGLGWWLKAAAADGTANPNLPAIVTSAAWSGAIGYRSDVGTNPLLLAAPGGGKLLYSWADYSALRLNITTTGPVIISLYGYSGFNAGAPQWSILDAATSATLATATTPASAATGYWLRATINGAVALTASNANYRIQGVLFTSVVTAAAGRLRCIEPGTSGLIG